jgi:hypothetical protein
MGQRGYTVAFLLVLLAACAGAFFGGRFLFGRLTGATSQATWSPPAPATDEQVAQVTDAAPAQAEDTALPPQGATAAPAAPGRTPTAPRLVLTPFVPPTPTFEPSSTPEPPSPTPAVTATATLTPTAVSLYPFILASPVRSEVNDCGGATNLILGQVRDRSGNPMPDVRLHLVDEFNAVNDTKATKSGATEAGRYDFPLFGPGRRYYLTVVDAGGSPLSERVEIEHGVGSNAKATCHWADWTQK